MSEHTSQEYVLQPKQCARCEAVKPPSEFYARSGKPHLLNSECKDCMRERSRMAERKSKNDALVPSEVLAINYLKRYGIHAVPGKAISYADVDVVAFGCIRIEVKSSQINRKQKNAQYKFVVTPQQIKRGFLADLVMLICDDGDEPTYHIFPVDCPVFYKNGRLKSALNFVPGSIRNPLMKSGNYILTQSIMDNYRNAVSLVWKELKDKIEAIKVEALIQSGDPFGGKADFGI